MMDIDVSSDSGRVAVAFELDRLSLAPGRYDIDVAVGTKAEGEIHRDARAASFVVPGEARSVGVLAPSVSVRLVA